jgi:hypothetical protein
MLPVPRSRGALSGTLLVLLGAWGALIPFVGPYFRYAYTPDAAWRYTSGRLWLEILPGAATVLGGLIVLMSRSRPAAVAGAWLAALSGAWFAAGAILSPLWTTGSGAAAGRPVGATATRVLEQVGFFTGLGLVIVFLAAMALGRFTVVGVRETRRAQRAAEAEQAAAKAEAGKAAAKTGKADTPAAVRDTGAPATVRDTDNPATVRDTGAPATVRDTDAAAEAGNGDAPADAEARDAPAGVTAAS